MTEKRKRGRPRKMAEIRDAATATVDDSGASPGVAVGASPESPVVVAAVDAGPVPDRAVEAPVTKQKPGPKSKQVKASDPFWFVLRAR